MKMKSIGRNKRIWISPALFVLFFLASCPRHSVAQTNTFPNDGNVGIGTSSPASKLVVDDTAQPTYKGRFKFGNSVLTLEETNAGLTTHPYIQWIKNGVRGMYLGWGDSTRIDMALENGRNLAITGGNVGIGTTSPDKLLTVQGSSNRRTLKLISDGDGVGYSGVDIVALTNTSIPENRAADFFLSMRKDTWYGGDGSGPSFIIETGSKSGNNYSAPFTITPTNDILLNSGRGVYGMPIGNVGIGTASPAYKLDVAGYIRSTSGGFIFPDGSVQATASTGGGASTAANISAGTFGASTGGGDFRFLGHVYQENGKILLARNSSGADEGWMWPRWSDNMMYTNFGSGGWNIRNNSSTNVMFLTNGGNVGIGTTSPEDKLTLDGTSPVSTLRSGGYLKLRPSGNDWDMRLRADGSGPSSYLSVYSGGDLSNPRMVVTATGNVGIGTTSPEDKLTLDGTSPVATLRSGGYLKLRPSGNDWDMRLRADGSGSNSYLGVYSGGDLSNPRMVVTATGKVGIGTSTPSEKLDVLGNISVGGSGVGNINATGTITGGNIIAKYQDVAEWVPASAQVPAGTVVVLDITRSNQVISSSQAYDTRVAGVVSAQPGIALGESGANKVLVATTGRVLVKVDASNGPIQIGDLLVTSDIRGVAMKSEPITIGNRKMHMPGTLIGKALEPLEKGSGKILVLLSLQ